MGERRHDDLARFASLLQLRRRSSHGGSHIKFAAFFFRDEGVDLFRTCISAPGAARQLLFRHARGVYFPLMRKKDADLKEKLNFNLVGGPSLIFTRYHERGSTFIRDNPSKPFHSLIGMDATNLYGKGYCTSFL